MKRLILLVPEACRRCYLCADSLCMAGKAGVAVARRGRCRKTHGLAWRSAALVEPPCCRRFARRFAMQTMYE